MAEQRLIDANAFREDWLEYDTNSFLSSIDDAPTIDPETIPVVRQLREELARVTAERDEAVKDRAKLADYELSVCEGFCFGDASHSISMCEWLVYGKCKLREWRGPQKEG